MPVEIYDRTFDAVSDKRAKLSNGSIRRIPDWGTNWTKIRLGVLFSINAGVANIVGTPRLGIGVLSGTALGFLENPLNWFGLVTNITSSTYNAGPPSYYTQNLIGARKVGSALTIGSSGSTGYLVNQPDTRRSCLIVQIEKGSPNFQGDHAHFNTTAGAQTDITPAKFTEFMEIGPNDLTNASSVVTGAAQGFISAQAIDEVANGYFNAVECFWDRTSPEIEVTSFLARRLA